MEIHPIPITDHGELDGRDDDDHTIYLLADGSRALAGAWDMGNQATTNVNIDSGAIDGVALGANADITYLEVDDIQIDGNIIKVVGNPLVIEFSNDSKRVLFVEPVLSVYTVSPAAGDVIDLGYDDGATTDPFRDLYLTGRLTLGNGEYLTNTVDGSIHVGAGGLRVLGGDYGEIQRAQIDIGGWDGSTAVAIFRKNSDEFFCSFMPGATLSGGFRFFDLSTTGENRPVDFYGFPAGQSLKKGSVQVVTVDGNPYFQISTTGTGISIPELTRIGDGGTTNYAQISATGDIDLYGTANNIENHTGDFTLKSAGTLWLESVTEIIKTGGTGTNCFSYLIGSIAGGDQYVSWQVQDATDTLQLTRSDAAVTKYEILMPVDIGDGTNYMAVSSAGVVSLAGTAKGSLTVRPDIDEETIRAKGVPTSFYLGAHKGFSLPLYVADPENFEELRFALNVPGRWDGVSDIKVHILVALSAAETAGDDFNLQLSWRNSREGLDPATSVVLDATTHDVTVETNIVDARKAQYNTFLIDFAINYDVDVTILAHDLLSMRLRRIAAAGTEIAGEIIVLDAHVDFLVDKMFKAS